MRPHLISILAFSLLLAASCRPHPTAVSEPARPLLKDGAPKSPKRVTKKLEAFVELITISVDGKYSLEPLVDGYALLEQRGSPAPPVMLNLATMETQPLPDFARDDYGTSAEFIGDGESSFAVAMFEDHEAGNVHFETFRVSTMSWEETGVFRLPARAIVEDPEAPVGAPKAMPYLFRDHFRVSLNDGRQNVASHRLDAQTLVWETFEPEEQEPNACFMPCLVGEDLVRWGFDPETQEQDCVSIRTSEDEPWRRIEGTERSIFRTCRRVDETRILASGGIRQLTIFPTFVKTAELIDLTDGSVKRFEDVMFPGYPIDLPGRDLVWMIPGEVVRFDPVEEKFSKEQAPGAGIEFGSSVVAIDDRTAVAIVRDADPAQLVVFGFREKSAN